MWHSTRLPPVGLPKHSIVLVVGAQPFAIQGSLFRTHAVTPLPWSQLTKTQPGSFRCFRATYKASNDGICQRVEELGTGGLLTMYHAYGDIQTQTVARNDVLLSANELSVLA